MNTSRRGFLGALLALPVVGRVVAWVTPAPKVKPPTRAELAPFLDDRTPFRDPLPEAILESEYVRVREVSTLCGTCGGKAVLKVVGRGEYAVSWPCLCGAVQAWRQVTKGDE